MSKKNKYLRLATLASFSMCVVAFSTGVQANYEKDVYKHYPLFVKRVVQELRNDSLLSFQGWYTRELATAIKEESKACYNKDGHATKECIKGHLIPTKPSEYKETIIAYVRTVMEKISSGVVHDQVVNAYEDFARDIHKPCVANRISTVLSVKGVDAIKHILTYGTMPSVVGDTTVQSEIPEIENFEQYVTKNDEVLFNNVKFLLDGDVKKTLKPTPADLVDTDGSLKPEEFLPPALWEYVEEEVKTCTQIEDSGVENHIAQACVEKSIDEAVKKYAPGFGKWQLLFNHRVNILGNFLFDSERTGDILNNTSHDCG